MSGMDASNPVLWRPPTDRVAGSALTRFATRQCGAPALTADPERDWPALHGWSVRERMSGARWFADARLNYAENLLAGDARQVMLIARDEGGGRRVLTRGELREQVRRVAAGFAAAGVNAGDVVAGYLANVPEAVVAMLAAAHLGAVVPSRYGVLSW